MARLAPYRLDAATAVIAILIAVAANSIAKVAIASSTGGMAFAKLLVPVARRHASRRRHRAGGDCAWIWDHRA